MSWRGEVVCDACGERFQIDVKVKPLRGGGERHFFRCPNKRCRKQYLVANITAEGVKLRRELDKAREELAQVKGEQQFAERLAVVKDLQERLKGEITGRE